MRQNRSSGSVEERGQEDLMVSVQRSRGMNTVCFHTEHAASGVSPEMPVVVFCGCVSDCDDLQKEFQGLIFI